MMPLGEKIHAFTTDYNGLTNQLVTPVHLSLPTHDINNNTVLFPAKALWDTGATNSVITSDTVNKLGLKPVSMIKVNHAGGVSDQNVHLVNIYLPNKIAIPFVQVTECDDITGSFGAIIGMDIITLGDLILTNFDKKSTLTFRIPSLEKIDFVKSLKPVHVDAKVGRNELCPCGSNKKYKYCHGIGK